MKIFSGRYYGAETPLIAGLCTGCSDASEAEDDTANKAIHPAPDAHGAGTSQQKKEEKTMKKGKQNRRWTASECLAAIYPKSARIRMLRLAVLSGLVRKMK